MAFLSVRNPRVSEQPEKGFSTQASLVPDFIEGIK